MIGLTTVMVSTSALGERDHFGLDSDHFDFNASQPPRFRDLSFAEPMISDSLFGRPSGDREPLSRSAESLFLKTVTLLPATTAFAGQSVRTGCIEK